MSVPTMSAKTLETNSIPIPPQLAGLLKQALGRAGTGFDEGAFLQQLHYWTVNAQATGWVIDGIKWIYNSLKSWQAQFPWMSEYGLRKTIGNLKKLGLIQTAQHWLSQYKRVMFYRIDYDKLNGFTENLCDLFTSRGVNSDQLDVRIDRITYTETSSDTSFSEQQTGVVAEEVIAEEVVATGVVAEEKKEHDLIGVVSESRSSSVEKSVNYRGESLAAAGSGKNLPVENVEFPELNVEFPELLEEVARAVGQPSGKALPASLRGAITQHPERVRRAIAYLQYQQGKRQIQNPVGYLYDAIVEDWKLTFFQTTIPSGFKEWFDRAKRAGLVIAATTINGIHHVLHIQQGWMATAQMMHKYPFA